MPPRYKSLYSRAARVLTSTGDAHFSYISRVISTLCSFSKLLIIIGMRPKLCRAATLKGQRPPSNQGIRDNGTQSRAVGLRSECLQAVTYRTGLSQPLETFFCLRLCALSYNAPPSIRLSVHVLAKPTGTP